jgi:hypothetical protein
MSIELHGSLAQEPSVLINTTVQEKNITYPTDAKLAIKRGSAVVFRVMLLKAMIKDCPVNGIGQLY